jgi:hypothetical protein
VTLAGIITYYYLVGSPLRCGGTYNSSSTPWIAMDIDAGYAVCGDRVTVIVDGISKSLIVRDSGNLSRYCIKDGSKCTRIIGDHNSDDCQCDDVYQGTRRLIIT